MNKVWIYVGRECRQHQCNCFANVNVFTSQVWGLHAAWLMRCKTSDGPFNNVNEIDLMMNLNFPYWLYCWCVWMILILKKGQTILESVTEHILIYQPCMCVCMAGLKMEYKEQIS